jgi:membrane-bound serine protease (ClpP class)
VSDLAPRGRVYVHGEYWDARSETPVAEGSEIEIVQSEANLKLLVRAVKPEPAITKEKEEDHVPD